MSRKLVYNIQKHFHFGKIIFTTRGTFINTTAIMTLITVVITNKITPMSILSNSVPCGNTLYKKT